MDELESHLLHQAGRQGASFWHDVRALAVIDLLPADRVMTIADIGAGAGLLGEILRLKRPLARYRFYEPLERLAEHIESRYPPGARLRDGTDVGDADVVALLDVVEHVERDRELLAEIVDKMRPDAYLVVNVPALPMLWSSWDQQLGHHRRYTRKSLIAAIDGLPIEVVETSYLFPELLPPALVRRFLRRRSDVGAPGASDFPVLPAPLDRSLRVLSGLTYRARRWWPAGTSVLLVARCSDQVSG